MTNYDIDYNPKGDNFYMVIIVITVLTIVLLNIGSIYDTFLQR